MEVRKPVSASIRVIRDCQENRTEDDLQIFWLADRFEPDWEWLRESETLNYFWSINFIRVPVWFNIVCVLISENKDSSFPV